MVIDGFYKEVIEALNKNDVKFLLVGGLAVGFYGYARYTGDMDLWLDASKSNLIRLGNALNQLKYSQDAIDKVIHERPVNHPTPIRLFEENEVFKVDLMTTIYYEPLTFEACINRAEIQILNGITVPIIGLKDLIEIKSNVKRYDGNFKDMVDAVELRKILEQSESKTITKKNTLFKRLFKSKYKG